jgi:DNA polymerase delta subunit 1
MESLYRTPKELNSTTNYTFQALEWHTCDEETEEDSKFIIRAFGVDENGYSVCCTISDYLPSMYIKIPKNWRMHDVNNFMEDLKKTEKGGKKILNYYVKDSLIKKLNDINYFKEFYGFTNNEKSKFCKLTFKTEKGMSAYKYAIKSFNEMKKDKKVSLYEVNIPPLLKFYHERDLQPSNWILIKKFREQKNNEIPSTCQVNIECSYLDVDPNNKTYNSNFLQASYDIETYSKPELNNDGDMYYPFPVASKIDNVIYQVSTCFKRFLEKDFCVKYLLTLKKCKKIEDEKVVVIECKDEKELLIKWKTLIESMDPDVLYQYNGDMFDCGYMVERAELLGIKNKFMDTSRLYDHPSELKQEEFSSSAYGTTYYKRLKMYGRINFDILIFIRREYKENRYKLDYISSKYLGEKKLDVTAEDIFKAYENGSAEHIKRIGEYCIQDSILPQKLVDVMHIFQTQISMSNITFVPIRFLIERGQQIKALSQISKSAKQKGFLIPLFEYKETSKFQGATVLEPDSGVYDIPITVLDFASLYPSIIRAHDLCYTTIVMDKQYLNCEGVEYQKIEIEGVDYYYAKNQDSVLKDLLENLAKERAKYKKLMKSTRDESLIKIYDKTQLAYKVSMNSFYGILGMATVGCKPIAATVTKIGREMIIQTKSYIESNHHNVFPEGYDSVDLDEEDVIRIKTNDKEMEIKVKQLQDIKGEVYIKTTKGWRLRV